MMGYVKKAANWLVDGLRDLFPLLICGFGGLMMMAAGDGFGWTGSFIAVLAFIWALDLSATKAAAKAKVEVADMFITNMTSGKDTELTVTFRDFSTPSQTERE